jgi:serine/threonine-protein kinase
VTTARNFGRYRVTGTLGAGAMGEVYAAVDDVLGREVAVKTLRGNASGLAARILDERFRQEARAIATLLHPGVVQVFDIDVSTDPPYLVMERVAGPSLKEQLSTGAFPADDLRALGIQIGRALAAAHAAGVVHRDVKPANILAAGTGTWKLADFGVAHVPDSSLTMTGQFVGSPAYAPPEALVRGQSGTAGDVYGLGATLYEAAAGQWPRLGDTTGALFAPLPPLRDFAPALPPDVAAVIDRAVSIEPDQRPTAAELADALAGAASIPGAGPIALPVPAAGTVFAAAGRAVRWKPWAIGAALVLAIVWLASTRGTSPSSLPLAPAGHAPPASRPTEILVTPPPGMDSRQAKDWNKIVDELDRGRFEGARERLDEFQDKYGETDETRDLMSQLDALGPDVSRGRGGHRGRGKKHRN